MTLWLVKGKRDAPGWADLERKAKAGEIEVVHFDRLAWAILEGEDAPEGYEGMEVSEPSDGLYVDGGGIPLYLVGRKIVPGPLDVIAALGPEATAMLAKIDDPDTALERLGRAF